MFSVTLSFAFVVLLLLINRSDGQMGYIGTAIQAFSPCPNGVLAMSREVGGPPKQENYWDGLVSLKDWPDIPEVRIALTVDNPAKIEIVSYSPPLCPLFHPIPHSRIPTKRVSWLTTRPSI